MILTIVIAKENLVQLVEQGLKIAPTNEDKEMGLWMDKDSGVFMLSQTTSDHFNSPLSHHGFTSAKQLHYILLNKVNK